MQEYVLQVAVEICMRMNHHRVFAKKKYSDKNNERKDKSTLISTRCRRNSSGRNIRVDNEVLTDGSSKTQ